MNAKLHRAKNKTASVTVNVPLLHSRVELHQTTHFIINLKIQRVHHVCRRYIYINRQFLLLKTEDVGVSS